MSTSHKHICLAGNCQVEALEAWIKLNLPAAKLTKLAPYHLLTNNAEIEIWLQQCQSADYIMGTSNNQQFVGSLRARKSRRSCGRAGESYLDH